MTDMRRYLDILTEASSPARPTFAAIARSPNRFVEDLRDIAIHYQEDIFDDFPSKKDIAQHLRATAASYAAKINNGIMTIYRGMHIPTGWNPAVRGLGIYWTFDLSYVFEGEILHGAVAEHQIDLWRTLLSEFTALTEREVTLFPHSTVRLDAITRDGEPILSAFVGREYQAQP